MFAWVREEPLRENPCGASEENFQHCIKKCLMIMWDHLSKQGNWTQKKISIGKVDFQIFRVVKVLNKPASEVKGLHSDLPWDAVQMYNLYL